MKITNTGTFLFLALVMPLTVAWSAPSADSSIDIVRPKRNPFHIPKLISSTKAGQSSQLEPGAVAAVPVEVQEMALPKMRLRAIIQDGEHSLASIDGQIVGLGESLHGYRLVDVGDRHVTLFKGGQRVLLQLDRVPGQ